MIFADKKELEEVQQQLAAAKSTIDSLRADATKVSKHLCTFTLL